MATLSLPRYNDRGLYFIDVDFLPCRTPGQGDLTAFLKGKHQEIDTGMALFVPQTPCDIKRIRQRQGAGIFAESMSKRGETVSVRTSESYPDSTLFPSQTSQGHSSHLTPFSSQLSSPSQCNLSPLMAREHSLRPREDTPMDQSELHPQGDFGATFVDSGGGQPPFSALDLVEATDRAMSIDFRGR